MPYELTIDRLQDISIKVVARFMTKQASLAEAITDQAKQLELNPEQIKRVIESSNTIAYLRQLESAEDRSFEFPVATYSDVIRSMVLPTSTIENTTIETEEIPKTTPTDQVESSMTTQEKVAMLRKETLRVRQTLTKMAEDGVGMSLQLEELSSKVSKDPLAVEKLTKVASVDTLPLLLTLCGLEKASSTYSSVFRSNDLIEVNKLECLLKEAMQMVSDKKGAETFVKQASEVLEKIALKSVDDASATKAQREWMDPDGSIAKKMSERKPGIIRKSVNSVVGAPVEFAGWVAGKTAKGVGTLATGAVKGVGKSLKAVVNGTSGRQAPGMPRATVGARLDNLGNLGGAALAGSTVSHTNPVWDSLH